MFTIYFIVVIIVSVAATQEAQDEEVSIATALASFCFMTTWSQVFIWMIGSGAMMYFFDYPEPVFSAMSSLSFIGIFTGFVIGFVILPFLRNFWQEDNLSQSMELSPLDEPFV